MSRRWACPNICEWPMGMVEEGRVAMAHGGLWAFAGILAATLVAASTYTHAQQNTPQAEALAIAKKADPLLFQSAPGTPKVFSTTAASLRAHSVSVPLQFSGSSCIWVVELNVVTVSHGPIGSKPRFHHALDLLVDLSSGRVVEAYSNH